MGSHESLRVLRIYHAGRNPAHRERERSLQALGIDLTLVVPSLWPEGGAEPQISPESFSIIELPVNRSTDVNRHTYADPGRLRAVLREASPDVLDVHEEPFSLVARQLLATSQAKVPVVMYTAQNVDKRFPPPFAVYERRAYGRVAALYPCSRQAASVARGKGFGGLIEVIPLGYEPDLFRPGTQSLGDEELVLALVGRLVPEKGVRDAVHVLARINSARPARLVVVGSGPEEAPACELATVLGVGDRIQVEPWRSVAELAEIYRRTHVVLVASVATARWTEQFGRVIVEAQASGSVVAGYESGSIPEVAGDAAVLVDPGDVSRLADEVVRLVGDSDTYAMYRERGLAVSRSRTWVHVARRQAELYRRVVAGEIERVELPRSPRARRTLARAEFGLTAPTVAGGRPFALPLLRRGGAIPSVLGALLDAAAEGLARSRRPASPT